MVSHTGKYESVSPRVRRGCPYLLIPLAFFLIELFAAAYLHPEPVSGQPLWPLAFGFLWAIILGGLLRLLPRTAGRICFGILFGGALVYSVGQTGYYQLFSKMMWLSEFRYASEGVGYLDILTRYPALWFVWIAGLLAAGIILIWKYPAVPGKLLPKAAGLMLALAAVPGLFLLPEKVFQNDSAIRYARSDYGRMQSAEAAYENMFSAHRLYQICGVYHTIAKDAAANVLSLGEAQDREEAKNAIEAWFETQPQSQSNDMTGILKGKNVILVLMESMDDWMLGEHTPTINQLLAEGINFTNFYTPGYGGIRTFNTEFCINTGSYLSSQGGYAFDYVTNEYNQSLAFLLRQQGYSAKTFHYNDPSFYSRGVFSQAMGYEEYVYYADYLTEFSEKEKKELLYDDNLLFQQPELRQEFFREGRTLNFLITRSAHLSYKYNEVLSYWALKKYPEYRGLTGNEETDCALLKARLVDDLFAQLLRELEKEGTLENTVIIGVTDHYTYGYKNEPELLKLSGVDNKLLMEKTPCFIWSADLTSMAVDKTLHTADLLPTVLNLLGVESPYDYIGRDAFDESYEGCALFSDGSWIVEGAAYDAASGKILPTSAYTPVVSEEFRQKMDAQVEEFVRINNLILDADYYAE